MLKMKKQISHLLKRSNIQLMQEKSPSQDSEKKMLTSQELQAYISSLPGTAKWLIAKEIQYGGYHTNVPRIKVSSQDPRAKEEIKTGGMTGGDRMLYHGYAEKYQEHLSRFIQPSRRITLIEVGILKGTGLAIWSDLFKESRIIGLDIDLSHINNNMSNLNKRGAFANNEPEIYEFDQFLDNEEYLRQIIKEDKVDICIDDGLHSEETILTTFASMLPVLNREFVYFIEDNHDVHKVIRTKYPEYSVENSGELTIVFR